MKVMTTEEHREAHRRSENTGFPKSFLENAKPITVTPGEVTYFKDGKEFTFYVNEYPRDLKTRPRMIRKKCETCGCVADQDYGTCDHCGAPL